MTTPDTLREALRWLEGERPAMERLLEEISFNATDRAGTTVTIDAAYVQDRVAPLAKNADLSRFIL